VFAQNRRVEPKQNVNEQQRQEVIICNWMAFVNHPPFKNNSARHIPDKASPAHYLLRTRADRFAWFCAEQKIGRVPSERRRWSERALLKGNVPKMVLWKFKFTKTNNNDRFDKFGICSVL
jgi:hypothetical protein